MSKKIIKVIALFLTFLLIFGTLPLNVVFAEGADAVVQNINVAAEEKKTHTMWTELIAENSPIPPTVLEADNMAIYSEYIADKIVEKGEYLTAEEIIEALTYVNANVTEVRKAIMGDIVAAVDKSFTLSSIGAVTVPQDVKDEIRGKRSADYLAVDITAEWTKVSGDAASLFSLTNGSLILNSRPEDNDLSATLTLTLTLRGDTVDIEYDVKVKKYSDEDEKVLDTLTFDVIKGENKGPDNINKNLNLVTSFEGKTVIWTSSKPAVIANDGKVTQPIYWGNTEILTLTAQIGSHTKVFNAVVNPTRFNQYKELNVENDGFEKVGFTSIPNWTRIEGTQVTNGIFENSTDKVFDGNYSLKVDDPQVGMFNGGSLGVREGHRYTGEVMVYMEEGASVSMMIMFFDMNSIQVGYGYSSLVGAKGGWQILRCEATAPKGAVMVRVYPILSTSSTAPAYLDNANIYEMPMLHNADFVPADIDATWFAANGKFTSTTTSAFAGAEYAFTGNAEEATTAAINFYNSNGIITNTYTKDISGNFDVRATAPADATSVSVTLGTTNRSIFSNLELNMSQKGTQVPDGSFESFAESGIPSWMLTTTNIATEALTFFENGDFEGEDLSEWNALTPAATITRSNEMAASGSYSGKVVATAAGTGVRSNKFDIIPGKEYTISFKAQTTDPTAQFYIEWWDATDNYASYSNFPIKSDVFKEYSQTITAPSNAVAVSVRPYFLSSGTPTDRTVYIDDVSIVTEGMVADNGYLFEKDFEGEFVDDWDKIKADATITKTDEKVASGNYAAKVVATDNGSGLWSQYVDVTPGKEYTIGFKSQSTDPTAYCYIEWKNAQDGYAAEGDYPGYSNFTLKSDDFKEHTFTMVAPSSAAKVRIRLYFVTSNEWLPATDRTIYIDDIYIKTEVESATNQSYAVVNNEFATDGSNGLSLSAASADSFWIPVLSGKDYAFTVDTKCETEGGAKATISYYDYNGNLLASESVSNTAAGNETLKLVTTAPTMAFNASVKLETEEVAFFDNVSVHMVGDTIGNPSFENTNPYKPGHHATQWQSHGGTVVSIYGSSTLDLPDGVFGLEIKGSTGGNVNSSMIKATPGVDYTARIKAFSKQGGSVRVSFYDANFKYISSSNATSFSGEEWTRYSANGVAPTGAVYAAVELVADANDYFIVDNTEFFTTTANIGGNTQLLIDDYIIKDTSGIDRTFHQAEISEPIMKPQYDLAHMHSGADIYGTVLYDEDEKIYKMWYTGINKAINAELDYLSALSCYATSVDGVNWEYPSLGIFSYNGSTDNNIFGNYHIPSVFKDYDEEDPNKRYKMVSYHHTGTHYSYFYSPDGLVWTEAGRFSDGMDVINATYDKINDQYAATVKRQINKRNQWTVVDDKDFNVKSYVMANTLADLIDSQNSYRTDSYGQGMYAKDGVYVGLNWVFNIPGTYAMEGPIKPQLTFSRDLTDEWQRPTRMSMIPIDEYYGNDSSTCVFTASSMIEVGDEVWMYSAYYDVDHSFGLKGGHFYMHIAKWRMDGFASLTSGNDEGVITTRPLSFDGTALKLNADASKGAIRVELLDASGNPIEGYTKADCDVITTDNVNHTVSWGGKKDISALKNSGVSLKIYSENSDIYSFTFGEPTTTKSIYTESETEEGNKLVGSVVEGDEFELPESTYTKDGYAFAGWKVSGTDEILKPGDKITVEGDMKLTAVWNLYGDFDGDNTVDAKEIAMVREFIIGKPDAEFIKEYADVNTDGDVDIRDLVVFVKNFK